MIDCLILGDSIAVGVGQHRPDCAVEAHIGITSADYLNQFSGAQSDVVVVSLGSNDRGPETYDKLTALRAGIKARQVWWVLPGARRRPAQRAAVRAVAREHGDGVVDIPELSTDGVHPTPAGYRRLGEQIR